MGESHTPHPPGTALHHRLNRIEGNKCCPVISPLIGLLGFASMEKQSRPARWAQPGATTPGCSIFPVPGASGASLSPAPSPQLSSSLGMSPNATPPVGPLGQWPGATGCQKPLARSQINSGTSLGASQPNGLCDTAAVTQGSERVITRPTRLRGRAGCSSCFLRRWGQRLRGGGDSQGHRPTASSAFPCRGKLRHGKGLSIMQRVSTGCPASQVSAPQPSQGVPEMERDRV